MHAMEEGVGSAEPSGGVVKKKSSSGCLIIKKKGDGIVGFGASNSKKGTELRKKKKRPRLILSDSESSDEPESPPTQRKIASKTNKVGNGSVVQKESFFKDNSLSKKPESESERKRSGLDVFEFDEYDGYDVKKMRKDDRVGQSGNKRESLIGSSSRNVMVDKIKHSYVDGKSSISGKSKGPIYPKKKHEEDDEAHLTLSSLREKYREACDEPIRLQGKNGVLKVMVNKQKKTGLNHNSYNLQESEGRKGSRSEHVAKTSVTIRPSFHSDSKRTEKRVSFVKTEKIELKSQKSVLTKTSKVKDSEKVDIDKPRKLGSASMKACSSTKTFKKEGKTTPITEKTTPIKLSTGTEKQKLREKVRSMLLDAGWTIDYRPRRNRDYLDAVYINPNGSAYWSIVKAYDALQKQLEEEDLDDIKKESSQSSPLPVEILSKLTRQTQKKMEREMKERSREDSEDKLSFYMKQNHKSRKRRSREGDDGGVEKTTVKTSFLTSRSGKTGRCTLLVRRSETMVNSEDNDDGFVPYMGKRTVLAWLIDSGTVRMSEKVQYMNRRKTRVMLEGWVTREGIHCGCCSKILSVSKFEIHAGSKQKQPFSNIFVESGISLLQCQIEAWNKQEEGKREGFNRVDVDGDDPNDDTCGLCGDGGDLICCDGCPSTFHQSCLDIEMLPQGEWYCPNCTCKFCGIGGGTTAEENGTTVSALFTCSLCEKKYHESCGQEIDDMPNSDTPTTTFCGETCRKLFGQLRKLLGVKHELEEGYSWSLIHRMDPSSSSDTVHPQRVECNSKLAVALSIMDECFLPIVDRRSEINLIQSVLYNCGSNFDRLNYTGFYTVILERGDEIICAASIRIRGTRLAEMPFIGTRHMYRRKGMCRRLFSAIESVLCSLKVEKLIIPAITEHMHTWTKAFNFKPLEELHKQEMRSFNMLVFPGIDMLQKQLVKPNIPVENITTNSDTKAVELEENHPPLPVPGKDTELNTSDGNELNCDETQFRVPSEETITVNATSESDADMKCPTPSDPSPVNLEISTPVLDPPVTDKTDDAQEVSGEASCVGLVLDKTAEASENLNPVSVSTVMSTENSDLNRQSAVEVETEIAPAEGSKREICEVDIKIASVGTIPVSSLEISAPNITEIVHENKSAVSCSLPKGTEEPNQPILDGDNHEGIDEGTLQLSSDLNNASSRETGCEVPLVSRCGSEAKVAEINVKAAHIETDISMNDAADETGENPSPTMEVNDSDGNVLQTKSVSDRHSEVETGSEVHVTTEVASSNGVH